MAGWLPLGGERPRLIHIFVQVFYVNIEFIDLLLKVETTKAKTYTLCLY